jgi:hypothetical protein
MDPCSSRVGMAIVVAAHVECYFVFSRFYIVLLASSLPRVSSSLCRVHLFQSPHIISIQLRPLAEARLNRKILSRFTSQLVGLQYMSVLGQDPLQSDLAISGHLNTFFSQNYVSHAITSHCMFSSFNLHDHRCGELDILRNHVTFTRYSVVSITT